MSCLTSIPPCQLPIIAAAITDAIVPGFTADELNVLGNLVVTIGSALLTVAAQQAAQESK
jgi:hypothetical protein